MKKPRLLAIVMLIILLMGCSSPKSPEHQYQQWEYSYLITRCGFDTFTKSIVCYSVPEEDAAMLDSIIRSKGAQGWELAEILYSHDDSGIFQTFIFKRQVISE